MQWSGDENAGFSRADPARLYSPVIRDPVYGYQAINVEAQRRTPTSLLNAMRHLVATRKRFRALGRGRIEFLRPVNQRVLAYLREYQGERLLIVNNLAASAQPVHLDLRAFAGQVPVEALGGARFPVIGSEPYPLSLGPYGYYWFHLGPPREAEPEPMAWSWTRYGTGTSPL
jgi:maltose alpha-D-glucosyltransferase/alpha-amylase